MLNNEKKNVVYNFTSDFAVIDKFARAASGISPSPSLFRSLVLFPSLRMFECAFNVQPVARCPVPCRPFIPGMHPFDLDIITVSGDLSITNLYNDQF